MRGGLINRGGCLCSSDSKQLDSWNEEIVEYNNKKSYCVTVDAFILKGAPRLREMCRHVQRFGISDIMSRINF